jgi:hypothetical protein
MQRRQLGQLLMLPVLQLLLEMQGEAAECRQHQAAKQQHQAADQQQVQQQAATQMKQSCVQPCSSVHSNRSSSKQEGVLLLLRAGHWQKLQRVRHGELFCGQGSRPLQLSGSNSSRYHSG